MVGVRRSDGPEDEKGNLFPTARKREGLHVYKGLLSPRPIVMGEMAKDGL